MQFRNKQIWAGPGFAFLVGDVMDLAPDDGAERCAAGLAEPAEPAAVAMLHIESWRAGDRSPVRDAADLAARAVAGWRLPADAAEVVRPDYDNATAVRGAAHDVLRRTERAANAAQAEAAKLDVAAQLTRDALTGAQAALDKAQEAVS